MALRVRKSNALPPPEGCPLTECMKLLGGAWTPNIIWRLSGGARRFGELRADIRLGEGPERSLACARRKGVLVRTVAATSPPSVEYALSPLGEELIPVISAIVMVGTKLKRRQGRE